MSLRDELFEFEKHIFTEDKYAHEHVQELIEIIENHIDRLMNLSIVQAVNLPQFFQAGYQSGLQDLKELLK